MCVNLSERYGSQYRISFDSAYSSSHVAKSALDPWMMQIPCQFGTIYPHGGSKLAVEIDYHPGIAKKVAELPGISCVQDGDAEKTYIFDLERFQTVADVVLPRKRRKLSEEQKRASAARLAEYRFKPAT
jgi:hypothetical protein